MSGFIPAEWLGGVLSYTLHTELVHQLSFHHPNPHVLHMRVQFQDSGLDSGNLIQIQKYWLSLAAFASNPEIVGIYDSSSHERCGSLAPGTLPCRKSYKDRSLMVRKRSCKTD